MLRTDFALPMRVSVIIPTLNEAACLNRTLRCLQRLDPPAWEIFVADGGSQDETIAIAEAAGIPVIRCSGTGRSVQMNQGARAAAGDVLCFVHADTLVPEDLVLLIDQTLSQPDVVGGGFISLMTGKTQTRWLTSFHNYLKTYYAPLLFRPHLFVRGLRLLFGDQVMFCRRSTFESCGGFNAALPIMEEADLCLKLVRHGKIRLVDRVVFSSDRRMVKWGFLKANWIYLYIGFLWGIGVSADYLQRFYEDVR
jgi:rSAM/selenodomain-associated transferase 2